MYLVQHQVPQKVIQTLMGHKDAKPTKWYTRVFALEITRQLGVRSPRIRVKPRGFFYPCFAILVDRRRRVLRNTVWIRHGLCPE